MPPNKSGRCRLLSCFACFSDKQNSVSAQPDSSQSASSSHTAIASASTAAPVTLESTQVIPSTTVVSHLNASDDIVRHNLQPSSASAVSSSQVRVMENDSQSLASSAITSSSHPTVTSSASPTSFPTIVSTLAPPAHDKGSHVGSSLIPASSSVPKESDHATTIRDIENASSAAALPVEPTQAISLSATAASPPNASDNILGHNSQPASPSAASSSQANASKDVRVMENDSQSVASSAVTSSSQATVTSSGSPISSQTIVSPLSPPAHKNGSQVGSSSTPSSSRIPKESDHTQKIRDAAGAVALPDADLNDLINYISQFLDYIKEKKEKKTGNQPSKPKAAKELWLSKNFRNLREVLSEGINVVKDVCPDVKTIAQGFLKGMGTAHMATTGLLVVANILERHEAISSNEEACLSLLKEMKLLARDVKELQKRPNFKLGMEASIEEATVLIVEASIACCSQIDKNKFSKFFSTDVDQGELANLEKRLSQTGVHMQRQMNLCLFDAIERLQKAQELHYPRYPNDAVGIEKPLRKVIDLLQWESDKKAVAVILHGFGGTGKTTLADAVFARLFNRNIEGCKYSFVRLFENIKSTPDIQQLQRCILRDLKMIEDSEIREFRRYEDGQQEIEDVLKEEVAFIYIDNVLLPGTVEEGRDALEQLLPNNMGNAKKLRLLLTARDKGAVRISGVKREFYPIETLPETEAVELFKKTLDDNEKQLNSEEINQIVKICGGVPKLLTVVAGFICSEESTQKAYSTVMEESKTNWKGEIGEEIDNYIFAYKRLDERLKDPFLDICSFFQGWDWEELSNIVGESELESLEKRALVTRDMKSRTVMVHDIILTIGLQKTEGERLRFNSESEIKEFLDQKEDEDLRSIKGIWSSDISDLLYIPASKIDLMYKSLRVLQLGHRINVDGKCQNIFQKLVFFRAANSHLPFEESKFKSFRELKYLCYNPEDLLNPSQMPSNVRHIDLFSSHWAAFEFSSNCIQQLRNLRVLRLKHGGLERLPQELGDLVKCLQELTFTGCRNLKESPESISTLGDLRVLRMDYCRLLHLPKDFGSLTSLQILNLRSCGSLETLPTGIEKLTSLQELYLGGCSSLKALPSSLEELLSLRLLDLSYAKDLPYGIGKLTSLVTLSLSDCMELRSIPENIGHLKLLAFINLSGTRLKELPDGFCNISSLTSLDMSNSSFLAKLPDRFGEPTYLRKLNLSGCVSLKKLPESFSQLKYLDTLDLSRCKILEELCTDFKALSSLRVLSLNSCEMLEKLPEDFHCLNSLKILKLRDCPRLEGKSMEIIVKMKTLVVVFIEKSPLLQERWGEIQREGNQSWSLVVSRGQGLSDEESRGSQMNVLNQWRVKFDSIFTNGRGQPFNTSDLPPDTVLLVMIDGRRKFKNCLELSIIEKNITDLQTNFKMIYVGNHFNKLPEKVADRIGAHAPLKSFEKVFPLASFETVVPFAGKLEWSLFAMSAKIVSDEKGDRYLSCWEILDQHLVEKFVVKKCGKYLKLKQLVERPGGSNIELLRELFASGEEGISLGFFQKGAPTKHAVHELEGKRILLDVRPANLFYDIPLRSLVEMYDAEKERHFEIITIPIMQENTKMDVSEKFSGEVPWLVLQNPWQLTSAIKYFLVEGFITHITHRVCPPHLYVHLDIEGRLYPNKMRIIESNGTIAAVNPMGVLQMVNAWGPEAYPFTEEKMKELTHKEVKQMKVMPQLMFLFNNLQGVSEKVKKAMAQQKLICLHTFDHIPNSVENVLREMRDSFYTIYVPKYEFNNPIQLAYFTDTTYATIKGSNHSSEQDQVKMQDMFSLNLSEHETLRFWARIHSLKYIIHEINDKDEEFDEMRKLLNSIWLCMPPWMLIMDQEGVDR